MMVEQLDKNMVPAEEPADRSMCRFFKRVFDVFFAALGLLCLSPLFAVVMVAVKLTDGGSIFYRQRRVGLGGRPFWILKFRTMVLNADRMGPSVTKDRDPRITAVGRILRRTKLDEMPQLWNVLVGEMSFVGPRPEVPKYVERYSEEQRRVLQLKPGITDLATLVFRDEESLLRNAVDVEEFYVNHCVPRKARLNLQYAERANMLEDVLLILQTLCPYKLGIFIGYALILSLSLGLSYLLRFEFSVPSGELSESWIRWLGTVPVQIGCLVWRRQFVGLLSFFDVVEMKRLANGLGFAAGLQWLLWEVLGGRGMPPRGVILINFAVAFLLIAGVRVHLRSLRERRRARTNVRTRERDTLCVGIIGAGELGGWLARQINTASGERKVVVFFDDDPNKWNRELCDVPVVGMPECLLDGSWSGQLHEVILAMPNASSERVEQIQSLLAAADIRVRILPSVEELLRG